MDTEEKMDLVTGPPTEEVITEDELRELFETNERPSAYIGIAPTGPFHMAYLISFAKMVEMQEAGIEPKILIADVHAAMDDQKAPWEELEKRARYYQKCIEKAFPWEQKPDFVLGSDFQYDEGYVQDLMRASTLTTVKRATRAASEVTRMKNPKISELMYPLMQCLDEVYLDVDIQLGGIDQRHILALARELLPKLGYESRVEVMTSLMVSLKGPGEKMSASIPSTHIKVYESEESIREKIQGAYCPEGETEDNPVLQLTTMIFALQDELEVKREEEHGGDVTFRSYAKLKEAFGEGDVHPLDLKSSVSESLIEMFVDAREYYENNRNELEELGEEFLPD